MNPQLSIPSADHDEHLVEPDTEVVIEAPADGNIGPWVERLRPSPVALDQLQKVEDVEPWGDYPQWIAPLDIGVQINGTPWGWTIDVDQLGFGDADWFLLPLGYLAAAETVASVSCWQSASMTGAVVNTTGLVLGDVSLGWQLFDEQGLTWRTVATGRAREAIAREIIASAFDGWDEPECPVCNESGWEITVSLADDLVLDLGASTVATVWAPCAAHASLAEVELSAMTWHWEVLRSPRGLLTGHWVPGPAPQAAEDDLTEPPWSTAVENRLLRRQLADRAPHLRRFLTELVALGCEVEVPDAQRPNYLNVQPASGHGRGRLCSVNATTGRVEFQTNSWFVADAKAVEGDIDHLTAGDKAAMDLVSDGQVDHAVRLAAMILLLRRGG